MGRGLIAHVRWLAATAVALFAAGGVGLAQTRLLLDDFENVDESGAWPGFVADRLHVKSGEVSARWADVPACPIVEWATTETDWSPYDTFSFWCFSERANGQELLLMVNSENPKSPGLDYWHCSVRVDWEGWEHIVIPFTAFQRNREPLGWDKVGGLTFACHWGQILPLPDTMLYFDELCLEKRADDQRMVVADMEFGIENWRGLVPTAALAQVGRVSGAWLVSVGVPTVWTAAIPHDWTGYDALEFWLHSASANGAHVKLLVDSDNTVTEPPDWYYAELAVDWEGWRKFRLPKWQFRPSRQPKGWHAIKRIILTAGEYGLTAIPGTELHLDEIALVRCDVDGVMIGDFEEGDEGWTGIARDDGLSRTGRWSARWSNLSANRFIRTTAIPHDWRPWDVFEFWIHSPAANGQEIILLLYSDNVATEKIDSFEHRFEVDWQGWRRFQLAKDAFRPIRMPRGWSHIDNITFGASGWGIEPIGGTVLHLDAVGLGRSTEGGEK